MASVTIMLDKSAFQALKAEVHMKRFGTFIEMIPPVLLREIMTDLSLEDLEPGKTPEHVVSRLAKKFNGTGGTINKDWRFLLDQSFLGDRFPMTGQILPEQIDYVPGPDGGAYLMEPTPENWAIVRWGQATFLEGEREAAIRIRRQAEAFQTNNLIGRLKSANLPASKDVAGIPAMVDEILARRDMTHLLIDWLVDQLRTRPGPVLQIRVQTKNRWGLVGQPLLEDFAPYAHHCARTLLMLVVGRNVLSQRPTNHVDMEYLLYLPFVEVFVSDDKIHRQIVPFLKRPNQAFYGSAELAKDPKALAEEVDKLVRENEGATFRTRR